MAVVTDPRRPGYLAPAANALRAVSPAPWANAVDGSIAFDADRQLAKPHVLNSRLADSSCASAAAACAPARRSPTPVRGHRRPLRARRRRYGVLPGPCFATASNTHRCRCRQPRSTTTRRARCLDVAVLVMDDPIPGPRQRSATSSPLQGMLTVAGFQPLDTDGSLLAEPATTTVHSHRAPPAASSRSTPRPPDASSGLPGRNRRQPREATVRPHPRCVRRRRFVDDNGELTLVGVISTVDHELTFNRLAPMSALHELLNNPDAYTHRMTRDASHNRSPAWSASDQRPSEMRAPRPSSSPTRRLRPPPIQPLHANGDEAG